MRRVIKILLLVFLGICVGVVAYEAIMFIRVSRLRSENPVTTSMIEARAREAKKEGEDDDWLPTFPDFKRGASTISQQLAKNLYLSSQRSLFRKGQEAILTVFLERMLTKRRLLELYLNVIEWGDGIYGAEAAAQHYFHKPASALNSNEAAFLSAMIPNPRTVFNPQVNPRRVSRRQRIILRGMLYIRLPLAFSYRSGGVQGGSVWRRHT